MLELILRNFVLWWLIIFKDTNSEEGIKEVFDGYDRNGNGFISQDELYYWIKNLSREELNEMIREEFNEADIDGDGQISYREFVKIPI